MSRPYPIAEWRAPVEILICWLMIVFAMALTTQGSWWLYPVSAWLISNRLLALSLLCHEGLHGNLSRHRGWNDLMGRYLCAFPSTISFSKYRRVHLTHHSGVGSEKWDPDRHLYRNFPQPMVNYLREQLWSLITLKTAHAFLAYYTDLPAAWKIFWHSKEKSRLSPGDDFLQFMIFYIAVAAVLSLTNLWPLYFLFMVLPIIIFTQPYVLLMGGLQHGPARSPDEAGGVSRSIRGSRFYMWALLPLDINYHGEHHRNSAVPHYHLRNFSRDLERQGVKIWQGNYREALGSLFVQSESFAQIKNENIADVENQKSEYSPEPGLLDKNSFSPLRT